MIFSGHRISDCIGEDTPVMLLRLAARWAFFIVAAIFCLPRLIVDGLRTWDSFEEER